MSLTSLAIVLLGLYLIVTSQTSISSVLTLIWGIVVVVLVVLDHGAIPARRRVP